MSITIKQLPELERPYEKLELHGEKTLSNAELLAIIIKTGTKEETSVQIAQKILKLNDTKEDDLRFLQNLNIEELKQIKGIGRIKAIQIKALCELAKRMAIPANYKKIVIREPNDIAQIMIQQMQYEKREIVKIVIMNSKNEVLKIQDISIGGANFVNLPVKDILSEPIKMQAPKIILVHNHPSGSAKPSKKDIEFTNELYDLADLMGIQLIDHLVIGNGNYVSIFSEIASKTKD